MNELQAQPKQTPIEIELKIDKEFKKLIPPLTSEELVQLEKNIIRDGCREPLVIWNGYIVDGHNRYSICTKNDIDFKIEEKRFDSRENVIEWIILNQFGRRNLLPFQRSELALRLKPIIRAKAKENQINAGGAVPQKSAKAVETRDELAKLAGVSHDTIEKVSKIQKEGTKEQIDRARQGGKGNSVNAIFNEVKSKDIKTKKCKKCNKTLPMSDFYDGKGECKSCYNTRDRSDRLKDVKGNVYKVDESLRHLTEEEIVGDLYDTDKEIIYGIDDLIEELDSIVNYFNRNILRSLGQHEELLVTDNRKKIMDTLSEVEKSINKTKEMFL